MKKIDVTAIGELLIDFVPDGKDSIGDVRLIRKAGGAPLNLLATVACLGLKTACVGKVGKDILGDFLLETVNGLGIDGRAIRVDGEHNTTLAFVELDENGDRKFSFYRSFGADRFIYKEDVDLNLIAESKVFHFGSLSLTDEPSASATEYAVRVAKENGCIVTYDPNFRAPLWKSSSFAVTQMKKLLEYVDIIKLSVDELEMLGGIENLKVNGIKLILVTDGANGSMLNFKEQSVWVPALKTNTVDTTGAGDIFFGSFIAEFIKSEKSIGELTFEDAVKFVRYATEVAGKSTEKHGAIASIPRIEN